MTDSIIDRIRAAQNLPTLPAVAIEVLELVNDDDVEAHDLAGVIGRDPALAARILRFANSSLYGLPRKVATLQEALKILGRRTVRVMVLGFSVVDIVNRNKTGGFDYPSFWRRSLATASAARLLAEARCPPNADETFVAGLLADVGMLAAWQCAKDLYEPVLALISAGQMPLHDIEAHVLGVTHADIGAALLDQWGLPHALAAVVKTHHEPMEAFLFDDPAKAVVNRTVQAAAMIGDLMASQPTVDAIHECNDRVTHNLPIDLPALQDVLDRLHGTVTETAALLDVPVGRIPHYQEIQAEAISQLASLTVEMEIERADLARREEAVRKKLAELNSVNRELVQAAWRDSLTGVANRAAMEDRIAQACDHAQTQQCPLGLLLLDLDRFKKLNDTFGHQIGDEALRQVGKCLSRFADDAKFAARYGGEEFAMIVAGLSAIEFRELAEEIRRSIQQMRVRVGKRDIGITASIGAAHVQPHDPELVPERLIERADQCLYRAKQTGRNRVVCWISRTALHR